MNDVLPLVPLILAPVFFLAYVLIRVSWKSWVNEGAGDVAFYDGEAKIEVGPQMCICGRQWMDCLREFVSQYPPGQFSRGPLLIENLDGMHGPNGRLEHAPRRG